MATRNDEDRIDANGPAAEAPEETKEDHGGSAVKQGLHGQAVRTAARGRDEFVGRGESSRQDTGRTDQAGRHYGRTGPEEPGPGYGKGPGQPDK